MSILGPFRRTLRSRLGVQTTRQTRAQRRHGVLNRRLSIEPLEDRRVLATIVVDSLADNLEPDGQITLREAVIAANEDTIADAVEGVQAGEGADVIEFNSSLAGGAIVLTMGQLHVSSSLSIVGLGADQLNISGDLQSRILLVDDGRGDFANELTVSGVSLTDGRADSGAAIYSRESIELDSVVIARNRATGSGGGIAIEGSNTLGRNVAIRNSIIEGNVAGRDGGGLDVGLFPDSTLVVEQTEFIDNIAMSGLGGGFHLFIARSSNVNVVSSEFTSNSAGRNGAGISVSDLIQGSVMSIHDSVMERNTATARGGGMDVSVRDPNTLLEVRGTRFEGNTALGPGGGANVFVADGSAHVTSSVFKTNDSESEGGAVYFWNSRGTLLLERNLILQNDASLRGGGVFGYNVLATSTRLIGNWIGNNYSAEGGGLYLEAGPHTVQPRVSILQNTLSFNRAVNGGGAWLKGDLEFSHNTVSSNTATAFGGGLFIVNGGPIQHSTIVRNEADDREAGVGGGVFALSGDIMLDHVILAQNEALRGPDLLTLFADVYAKFSLVGTNRDNGLEAAPLGTPDADGNLIGTSADPINPQLQPLVESLYGAVHNPLPTSPAIDSGDEDATIAEEFDPRGAPFGRVVGDRIDIGAVEFQTLPSGVLLVDSTADIIDGDYGPGNLSLREAVAIANGSFGADIIRFDLPAGSIIALSSAELRVVEDIVIVGPGTEQLTVKKGPGGIFHFDDARTDERLDVALSGLTLDGEGSTTGSAVYSAENLHAESLVLRSASTWDQGDMYIRGNDIRVELQNVQFLPQSTGEQDGPALTVVLTGTGTAELSDVIVEGVGGEFHAAVRFEASDDSSVTVQRVRVEKSLYRGMAVELHDEASFFLSDSHLAHNAGGLMMHLSDASQAVVQDSTFANNSATEGGGVNASLADSQTSLFIQGATIIENVSNRMGGGIVVWQYTEMEDRDAVIVRDTLIANNISNEYGGGISIPRYLRLINSTITGNSAPLGSGIYVQSVGGTSPYFQHVTVTNNSSSREDGGAIHLPTGTLVLRDSIVASNMDPSGIGADIVTGRLARIDAQYSLIGHNRDSGLTEVPFGSPDANGNLIGGPVHGVIDPRLAPLADNGGVVPTHALLAGSSAIDAGDPAAVAGEGDVPEWDQRGEPFSRVRDGDGDGVARIDIGAIELQEPHVPEPLPGDYNGNGLVEQADLDLVLGNWGRAADAVSQTWIRQPPAGIVDQDELDAVLSNWGRQAAPASTSANVGAKAAALSERSRGTGDARTDLATLDRAFTTRKRRADVDEPVDDVLDVLVARTAAARAHVRVVTR
jgi:hypothetical protein